LTSVHVNRTLKVLRQSNALTIDGQIVRIDDWPALAGIADFDSAYLQECELQEAA
jgi:hypothetical protein